MNYQQEKFVRFQDWKSEKSTEGEFSTKDGIYTNRVKNVINSMSNNFQRSFKHGSEGFRNLKGSLKSYSLRQSFAKSLGSRKKVLDPRGSFLQKWNKIFVLSCVMAVSLDPYIPVVDNDKKCLGLDLKLEVTVSVLRSFTDIFYIIHIIFQFRTGFIAPSSRVFGRGVLVEDSWAIAKRYLSSYFLIDVLAVLPLPQVTTAVSNFGE